MTDIDEQSEEIRGRGLRQSGGGSISSHDPRFSHARDWAMGILAVLIGAAIIWFGSTLVSIKESLATLAATSSAQTAAIVAQLNKNDSRDDAQDARVNGIDGRVYTLEGRNLRGGPEVRRGN
jgi:hypothetical protein